MNFLEELAADRKIFLDAIDANKGDINLDIFEDFYPDEAHFIYELLQNAEKDSSLISDHHRRVKMSLFIYFILLGLVILLLCAPLLSTNTVFSQLTQ